MLLAYARVSSDSQDTAAQVADLQSTGWSGSTGKPRPVAVGTAPRCINSSNNSAVDVLVVWKLDSLSRSLRLNLMEKLAEAQTGFRSLTEAIDTTSAAGGMFMQVVGAFAEFERVMLRERTRTGLENARRAGRLGDRRPEIVTAAAIRNYPYGGGRRKDRRRCRPSVPYPPDHCFPSAGALGLSTRPAGKSDRQNHSSE